MDAYAHGYEVQFEYLRELVQGEIGNVAEAKDLAVALGERRKDLFGQDLFFDRFAVTIRAIVFRGVQRCYPSRSSPMLAAFVPRYHKQPGAYPDTALLEAGQRRDGLEPRRLQDIFRERPVAHRIDEIAKDPWRQRVPEGPERLSIATFGPCDQGLFVRDAHSIGVAGSWLS